MSSVPFSQVCTLLREERAAADGVPAVSPVPATPIVSKAMVDAAGNVVAGPDAGSSRWKGWLVGLAFLGAGALAIKGLMVLNDRSRR